MWILSHYYENTVQPGILLYITVVHIPQVATQWHADHLWDHVNLDAFIAFLQDTCPFGIYAMFVLNDLNQLFYGLYW